MMGRNCEFSAAGVTFGSPPYSCTSAINCDGLRLSAATWPNHEFVPPYEHVLPQLAHSRAIGPLKPLARITLTPRLRPAAFINQHVPALTLSAPLACAGWLIVTVPAAWSVPTIVAPAGIRTPPSEMPWPLASPTN